VRSRTTTVKPDSRRGFFIGIEGIDAVGKRTQTTLLVSWLRAKGITTGMTSFPDYTTEIGKEIHGFFHGTREYPPEVIHMLFAANRWEDKSKVESMLAQNQVVVVDRYSESNLAYGLANGLRLGWLESLEAGLPKTDLVLVLDAPPSALHGRRPESRDPYERSSEVQEKAREAYVRLARRFGWKIIDASQGVQKVHESLTSAVANFVFPRNKGILG
jgi:dTMP kinase